MIEQDELELQAIIGEGANVCAVSGCNYDLDDRGPVEMQQHGGKPQLFFVCWEHFDAFHMMDETDDEDEDDDDDGGGGVPSGDMSRDDAEAMLRSVFDDEEEQQRDMFWRQLREDIINQGE